MAAGPVTDDGVGQPRRYLGFGGPQENSTVNGSLPE
jgi:hypothetical protein